MQPMKTPPSLTLSDHRDQIRQHYLADEVGAIKQLMASAALSVQDRKDIGARAVQLIQAVRQRFRPTIMEQFLAEYGLNTAEGIALMSLSEALLRVPDRTTAQQLITDKLGAGNWRVHAGKSPAWLINLSTRLLQFTSRLLVPKTDNGIARTIRSLSQPIILFCTIQVMRELGGQFVLGRNIAEAVQRSGKRLSQGYTHSFDMLGEAARTDHDALRYLNDYKRAITELKAACTHQDTRDNPGISVKLSALFPRYEFAQKKRVMNELVPRVLELAKMARDANMGFNIDAEEMDRLDLSLDIIEAVLSDPGLSEWDGFGVVVQAYGARAFYVLDWLYALAETLDRRIMVRLVKGAYWDAEIKRAQVMGLAGFPVFTRKTHSDISYIACAGKLFSMTDRIYPQFATHNAHTVAAVQHLAGKQTDYEFQRLHGMGESLYDVVMSQPGMRCRIYAPVGAHEDLLAYLVRRLLENGANSSFVHQIADTGLSAEKIAADPFAGENISPSRAIARAQDLFAPSRLNSVGWDLTDPVTIKELMQARDSFSTTVWQGEPLIQGTAQDGNIIEIFNPANSGELVGRVQQASAKDVEQAIVSAQQGFAQWAAIPAAQRAEILNRIARLYEQHAAELFALACREAGKTLADAIAEVREAVDFARYYAVEAVRLENIGQPLGIIVCISPWNFPLAIFTGQILAAIAAGNTVIAKPAEQTALMASRAVQLMYEAGIPPTVLQLLPGAGDIVGAALTADSRIAGVCFTGSTATAQYINRSMARNMAPDTPLVAETGGLNAMIVDSTALLEQVVRDVLMSSFQSAGQRCSALRIIYIQEDVANAFVKMLSGAMEELTVGNPWLLETDIGPVIDDQARQKIVEHCQHYRKLGCLIKQIEIPENGTFVSPAVIRLDGIEQLDEEIFGPILHVATYKATELDNVIKAINDKGYGLTFGLHTRMESRQRHIAEQMQVGNIYINRNQIGAIVGSQPFGGEGLSGTGPKAGGPRYVQRFKQISGLTKAAIPKGLPSVDSEQLTHIMEQLVTMSGNGRLLDLSAAKRSLPAECQWLERLTAKDPQVMPGPVGEINQLSCHARGVVLCLGPTEEAAKEQLVAALLQGNSVIVIAQNIQVFALELQRQGYPVLAINGELQAEALLQCAGFQAVLSMAPQDTLQAYRQALADRDGALIPLITDYRAPERLIHERHICIDTTAAGGNASLIAVSE